MAEHFLKEAKPPLTYAECAEIMGIPRHVARDAHDRGIRKLRALLGDNFLDKYLPVPDRQVFGNRTMIWEDPESEEGEWW